MKNLVKIVFLILLGISIIPSVAAQYKTLLTGRSVDSKGKPVAEAIIIFDVAPELKGENCDGENMGVMSGNDGRFAIKVDCEKPDTTIFLFVVPSSRNNEMTMLAPPFDDSLRTEARFAGVPILIKKNKNTELGDVPVQVSSSTVELYILDKSGQPYFKSTSDWAKLIVLLRGSDGYFVTGLGLSTNDLERRINLEKGYLRLALPEGEWTIDLVTDWDDFDYKTAQIWNPLASAQIIVTKSDTHLKVYANVK